MWWTPDINWLADVIDPEIEQSRPSGKLTRTFFRRGRIDGKRRLPPESTAHYIESAVAVATHRITERYLQQLATSEQAIARTQQVADELDRLAVSNSPTTNPEPTSTGGLSTELAALREQRQARRAAEASRARQELARLTSEKGQIRGPFREQIEGSRAAGELLWAGYCRGYHTGLSRRGAPDDEIGISGIALDFEVSIPIETDGVVEAHTSNGEDR